MKKKKNYNREGEDAVEREKLINSSLVSKTNAK